jgi:hypothetical protein
LIFYFFLHFQQAYPEECCISFKSKENYKKNCFDPVTASSLVLTFWVIRYIRGCGSSAGDVVALAGDGVALAGDVVTLAGDVVASAGDLVD